MEFAQFVNLKDSFKVFRTLVNLGEDIHDYTWVQHGVHVNLWYTTYREGFPNFVTEDGVEYTERFTLAEANANVNSFYYDLVNQVLYLRTTNTDDPGSMTGVVYDYTIVALSWHYYTNSQYEKEPIIYPRVEDFLTDGGLEVWSSSTNLTHWTETLAGASTVNRETTTVYAGGYSVKLSIDAANANAQIDQDLILPPRHKCTLSFWYKNSAVGKTSKIQLRDSGSNVYLDLNAVWQPGATTITLANQTTWTKYELEFYVHESYTNYNFLLANLAAASSDIFFDDLELKVYREDNYHLPYLFTASLPTIREAVSDFHIGTIQFQAGKVAFINDGYFYTKVQDLHWANKELIIEFGAKGSVVDEFEVVVRGKTGTPKVSDTLMAIDVGDSRIQARKELPATKYWVSNYANLEDGAEGLPIPIIYGQIENIIPTEIDTTIFKYKISIHTLEDITAVKKDGVALTNVVDYTKDLTNGEFTLVADPAEALITCDVKGKKISLVDGSYSENVADILYDLLTAYGDVDKTEIDYESFLDLRGARTQDHHLYLDLPTTVLEVVRILQASALFHLKPLNDGTLGAFRYKTGVDAGTPRFIDEDYKDFVIIRDDAGVYKEVRIRYNKNPGNNAYESVVRTDDDVEWKYGRTDTLPITTSLRLKVEAENLGDFYIALVKDPRRQAEGSIPSSGFDLQAAEKSILNKTRLLEDGSSQIVLSEDPYRMLVLEKNLSTGRVSFEALEDLQSAGESYCEVCFACEVCVTTQAGACAVCVACEKCVAAECDACQSCFFCQACDAGECIGCQSCDACQNCNTCENCNVCQASQCASCVACQKCDTCQNAQCSSCEDCNVCQTCVSGQCTVCESCDSCQDCYVCQSCDAGECSTCQTCDVCQKCDIGQCSFCQSCDACQNCFTCESCNVGCQICVGGVV